MSLEGLRAWIGEVERKLGTRTRVFLALTTIAIGIAGASLYLAIDARNSSVSEADVQELQEQLETRIDEIDVAAATSPAAEPEVEPKAQPEVKPEPKPEAGQENKGEAGGTSQSPNPDKLQELAEQASEPQK